MELQALVYGKYECFVMQMLYVCVVCASCDSPQCCCIMHYFQLVNDGRECKGRPYRGDILQSLIGSHACFLLFAPCCYGECFYYLVSVFIIWRGLCVCTEL